MAGSNSSVGGNVVRNRGRIAVLAVMNAVYFFSFFQRVAVPGTIFDELQSAFGITAAAVAGLGATYLYIYAGMQLVAGSLCDRFGAGRVFLAGAFLLSAGSLLFPLAPVIGLLYAARALVGLGASLIYLSVVKALDQLFSHDSFPRLLGVSLFLGYAGGLVGTLPFERAVSAIGWRQSLFAAGILCTAAAATGYFMLRRMPRMNPTVHVGTLRLLGQVFRNRLMIPLLVVGPVNFAIYYTVQATIGKKMLGDYLHLSTSGAAMLTFAMMFTTMCTALFGGFLLKAIGNRRKSLILVSLTCVLAGDLIISAALHWGLGTPWFMAAYVLMACSGISMTSGAALVKDWNPKESLGIGMGALNGVSYLAVAVATSVVGLLLDGFRASATMVNGALIYPVQAYQAVFGICATLSVIVIVVAVVFLKDSRGESAPEILAEE